jgi:hypothetical protein
MTNQKQHVFHSRLLRCRLSFSLTAEACGPEISGHQKAVHGITRRKFGWQFLPGQGVVKRIFFASYSLVREHV